MSVSPLIVKYEKTLARNPRSQVFAPLSELYRKIGLMDKAQEVLQNGIRYNPDYIPGYIELANYYIDLREVQLAHATLRPLVNSNRDNLKLQKLFVRCCTELEYKSEALDTLKYLLFLNPKDRDIAEKISILEKEDLVVADVEESQAIQFNVDSLDSHKVEEEDYGGWVEVNTSQVDHDETPEVNDDNGWSIENIKAPIVNDSDDSIEDPGSVSPKINHALVEIYLEQGHIEKAKDIIEKILEIQPDDEGAQLKLQEINDLIGTEVEDPGPEPQNIDFNTGSLMEVFDKKVAHFNSNDAEKVEQKLELFLGALRDRGGADHHL